MFEEPRDDLVGLVMDLVTGQPLTDWFMFMVRWEKLWRFILVPRDQLDQMRDRYVAADRTGRVGAKPKPDGKAQTDVLALDILWTAADATGWNASFKGYMDVWPSALPDRGAARSIISGSAAPLRDRETG